MAETAVPPQHDELQTPMAATGAWLRHSRSRAGQGELEVRTGPLYPSARAVAAMRCGASGQLSKNQRTILDWMADCCVTNETCVVRRCWVVGICDGFVLGDELDHDEQAQAQESAERLSRIVAASAGWTILGGRLGALGSRMGSCTVHTAQCTGPRVPGGARCCSHQLALTGGRALHCTWAVRT